MKVNMNHSWKRNRDARAITFTTHGDPIGYLPPLNYLLVKFTPKTSIDIKNKVLFHNVVVVLIVVVAVVVRY